MKKLIVVCAFAVATVTAYAQRPVAGAKGFTFEFGSPFVVANPIGTSPTGTGSLLFKYYVSDDIAARVSIGYSKTSTKSKDTSNVASLGEEVSSKNSTSTFNISLGAQKAFGESEKIEPYIGADIVFSKTGGKYESETSYVNTNGGRAVGDYDKVTADGSFTGFGYNSPSSGFGLLPVVGFNYYFTENFAFGAEFGWGITLSTNNKKQVEEVSESKNGATTTTTKNYFNTNGQSITSFGTSGTGAVTVSVLF